MLGQEMASVARACLEYSGITKAYYREVPERFETPSVYFPDIYVSGNVFSLSSYTVTYSWKVQVFDQNSESADERVFRIMESILHSRNRIPIYGSDGVGTGEKLTIRNIGMKRVDTGVTQLELGWQVVRRCAEDIAPVIEEIHINGIFEPYPGRQAVPGDEDYIE